MPDSPAPVLADRYQLGDVLGSGGMADVLRAHDLLLDRPVAVKVLRETAGDETDRARFTAEARTLAMLSHVGLVMVLDAGISAEQPFLVMDLVEGPTLAQVLGVGPVALETARSVGVQVADALAYAHAQGVVHRDVKPGNVLLGAEGRVKLADFGIARLIGDTVRHTRTGTAIGTAAYLAPEQVTGKDVTGAADVYSLGLVLLESLTGERAYPGPATEAALARLHRAPAVPSTLPEAWRGLLAAMTTQDPDERPTAAEVAEALRRLPTSPPPPPLDPREPTAVLADPAPTAVRRTPSAADRLLAQARALPTEVVGVAGVVVALVVLIVLAGLLG